MKLDHVFIGTSDIGSAVDAVSACGFIEGSTNVHPGQGTANRRYFFSNTMLELLYVDERVSSDHPQNHLLELEARCRASLDDKSTSKLDVCFRPSHSDDQKPLFECLHYKPSYLPSSLHIDIDRERCAGDPLWFQLPFSSDAKFIERTAQEPRDHPAGVECLTRLHVTTTADSLSSTARIIEQATEVSVETSDHSVMIADFDNRAQGQVFDLRPLLPLIVRV